MGDDKTKESSVPQQAAEPTPAKAAPAAPARHERRGVRRLPLASSAKADAGRPAGPDFPEPVPPADLEALGPDQAANKKLSRRKALRQMVGLSVGSSLAVLGLPACEAVYTDTYTNSYGGSGYYYSNSGGYTNSGGYYNTYTNSGGYYNTYTNYYVTYTNVYTNYYVTYTNVYTNYYVTYTNYYY